MWMPVRQSCSSAPAGGPRHSGRGSAARVLEERGLTLCAIAGEKEPVDCRTWSRLRFEYVCVPEQPLKLYPTAIVVTFSSYETVNVIGTPCDVLPFH
jgi:hypothetical protein